MYELDRCFAAASATREAVGHYDGNGGKGVCGSRDGVRRLVRGPALTGGGPRRRAYPIGVGPKAPGKTHVASLS